MNRLVASICAVGFLGVSTAPGLAKEGEPGAAMHGLTEQTRRMGGPRPPEQLALSIEHLGLAVKVFPYEKRIEAEAVLSLRADAPLREVLLDLYPNFHVDSIRIDGAPIERSDWSNPDGLLRARTPSPVAPGQRFEVRIAYAGFPHVAERPPWEGGMVWSETGDGTPWIGSSHWGAGCDLLWPCIDHPTRKPATVDFRITVPASLVAPANGVLVDVDEHDGWKTWHWRARSPHTYGLVLNIGPYEVLEGAYESRYGNTIPMRYWHLPEHAEQAEKLFEEFPQILEFFESRIGPYPWADQKMGVVETPHLGMEHQTINAYGNDYRKTEYGFDSILQHEFSHEYFANQVSVANYDDLWIHEGFGSYMQPLYGEWRNGLIDYLAMLKSTRAGVMNEAPLVSGEERTEKEVYADEDGPRGDVYGKGSLVMHTLRQLVGDEAFFESVRILVYGRPDPAPGNFDPQHRTTQDFLEIVNKVTGKDLSWFFDVYFYHAALPVLEHERRGSRVIVTWNVADDLPFPMPLQVLVGDELRTLPMTGNRGELTAPEDEHLVFDPHARILRQSDAIDQYRDWKKQQEDDE